MFNLSEGKLHIFALLALTLLGAYLRFLNLSQSSVWGDEAMTAFFASLPYRILWTTPLEPHPPLYYSLVRMVFEHGDGEGALRLVSAISGAIAIPIVYAIGRVCVTPSVGLLAALILSVSNVHIEYSQEARSYALLTTIFAITVLFTALYCKNNLNPNRVGQSHIYAMGFFIFSIIGYFTHMIFIYYSFTTTMAGLFYLVYQHKGDIRLWRWARPPWLYIFGSLSAALVWIGLYLWLAGTGANVDWLKHFTAFEAAYALTQIVGFWSAPEQLRLLSAFVPLICLLGLIAVLREKKILAAALIVFTLGMTPALIWLTGFIKPVFVLRTILPVVVTGAICVGSVWLLKSKVVPVVLIAAYVMLSTLGIYNYHTEFAKHDWRSATPYIRDHADANAAVLLCRLATYWSLEFYDKDLPQNVFATGGVDTNEHVFEIEGGKLRMLFAMPLAQTLAMNQTDLHDALTDAWPQVRDLQDLAAEFDEIWIITHADKCAVNPNFASFGDFLLKHGFEEENRIEFRGKQVSKPAVIVLSKFLRTDGN